MCYYKTDLSEKILAHTLTVEFEMHFMRKICKTDDEKLKCC